MRFLSWKKNEFALIIFCGKAGGEERREEEVGGPAMAGLAAVPVLSSAVLIPGAAAAVPTAALQAS